MTLLYLEPENGFLFTPYRGENTLVTVTRVLDIGERWVQDGDLLHTWGFLA
jgi:hypothetical protein